MKKLTALLLSLALALTAVLAFAATPTDLVPTAPAPEEETLLGLLTGWTDDGYLLLTGLDGGLYEVLIDPAFTDLADADFITEGDLVIVYYDGKLTRSIPAQLTASYIGSFKLSGTVESLDEDGMGFVLLADGEAIHVALNETMPAASLTEGRFVIVYFDGMMTRSIPAQVNALYLRTADLVGQVTAIRDLEEDDGTYAFMMDDESLGEVLVRVTEETMLYTDPVPGEMVFVSTSGMMTMSLPPQVVALEVLSLAAPAME